MGKQTKAMRARIRRNYDSPALPAERMRVTPDGTDLDILDEQIFQDSLKKARQESAEQVKRLSQRFAPRSVSN